MCVRVHIYIISHASYMSHILYKYPIYSIYTTYILYKSVTQEYFDSYIKHTEDHMLIGKYCRYYHSGKE